MPTNTFATLCYAVTGVGALLLLSFGFLFVRGERVPSGGNEPHKIKYGEFEMATNMTIMMLALFAVLTAVPLYFLWRLQTSQLENKVAQLTAEMQALQAAMEQPKKRVLTINGNVIDERNEALTGARIRIVRDDTVPIQLVKELTSGEMGEFNERIPDAEVDATYRLQAGKDGYSGQSMVFGAAFVGLPLRLVRQR